MAKKPPKGTWGATEDERITNLDLLAEFQNFKEVLLEGVQKDILSGMTAEQIYAKYSPAAAGRVVTVAATEIDSGKALAAAREILDRGMGKATEKKEVTHKYKDLSDEELASLVATTLSEADEDPAE